MLGPEDTLASDEGRFRDCQSPLYALTVSVGPGFVVGDRALPGARAVDFAKSGDRVRDAAVDASAGRGRSSCGKRRVCALGGTGASILSQIVNEGALFSVKTTL